LVNAWQSLPLPQNLSHFLQRPAHAQQLVFAEDDQAFIVRIVGRAHELDDLRVDGDLLAPCVGHADEGYHGVSFFWGFPSRLREGLGEGASMASFLCILPGLTLPQPLPQAGRELVVPSPEAGASAATS
jgi:hypothetical protein